jgi:hypothetical protein
VAKIADMKKKKWRIWRKEGGKEAAQKVFEFPPFVRASALSYGRKISGRLRVKRESLTGVEVHIGFACASSVRGVVV